MSYIKTTMFGSPRNGTQFDAVGVAKIGLQAGTNVDQINLNDKTFGGSGGTNLGSLTLSGDEYISAFEIRSGWLIDHAKFTTNKGRVIQGGGDGGNLQVFSNLRVISIAGRSGDSLDQLNITYAEDYKPSTKLESDIGFIVKFSPPLESFEKYSSSQGVECDSYESVTSSMTAQTYSASVEAEYYAKVSVSAGLAITDSKITTIQKSLQNTLNSSEKTSITIPAGSVGVSLIRGDLMCGDDGKIWISPTTIASYAVIDIVTGGNNLLNHYDLTGELHTQMSSLVASSKNGYTYYESLVKA